MAEAPAIGPWLRGIVNTVDPHSLTPDALYDAVDCNIDRDGSVESRHAFSLLDDTSEYHSIFAFGSDVYAGRGAQVGKLSPNGFTVTANTNGDKLAWTVVTDRPVCTDGETIIAADGGDSSFVVNQRPGREFHDQQYAYTQLEGGRDLAYWRGRLLVLRSHTLRWSEPLEYGAHSATHNYLRLPEPATWLAALDGGVFVGGAKNTYFFAGTAPENWTMRVVGKQSAPYGRVVTGTQNMPPELVGTAEEVAVWFTDVGFAVGKPDGSVSYPQASNIEGLPLLPRNLVVQGDRIYAFAR